MLLITAATAGTSFGVEYYLRAEATTKTMPDGRVVPVWGFAKDSAFGAADGLVTVPGPVLTVPPDDATLTIHLDNNLGVPISLVIPGQTATMTPVFFIDGEGRRRVQSFTHETPAGNAAAVDYTWTDVRPGTFIYHSGSHANVQVPMGLYGMAIKDYSQTEIYDGVAYDHQIVLCYSQIDPALNDAVAADDYGPGKTVTSTIDYAPKYFLVNGIPYSEGDMPFDAAGIGSNVLLRMANAGIETCVPMLNNLRAAVLAEDGFPYEYAADQYAIVLDALKTKDAIVATDEEGVYPLYDRRLRLTNDTALTGGLMSLLDVGPAEPSGVLLNDNFNDGNFDGWTVVDEGTLYAPSQWSVSGGVLRQSQNTYGPPNNAVSLSKLGTYLVWNGGAAWGDYAVDLSMRSNDDDVIGVMFRYQNANNYYRFSWDRERPSRRLVKNVNGVFTLLAADAVPYISGQTYQVRVAVRGPWIDVYVDGVVVLSAWDGALASGSVALYCWANSGSLFDNVVVQTLPNGNFAPYLASATATPSVLYDNTTSQLRAVAADWDAGPGSLTYAWTASGGVGAFSDPAISDPVYTPPDVAAPQLVTLTVDISDGHAAVSKSVDVTIMDATLLFDNFNDGNFTGWTVLDEGTVSAPSNWSVRSGVLTQFSNIYGAPNSAANLSKLGTYLAYDGGGAWTDYTVDLTMQSNDDDVIGVMFRYQNANNYYRFSWDRERLNRRLVKRVNGVFTLLAEDVVPYVSGQSYHVQVLAVGSRLAVKIDGLCIFAVEDPDLAAGSVALYTWANARSYFDDVLVMVPPMNLAPCVLPPTATPSTIRDNQTSQLNVTAIDLDSGPGPLTYNWSVPAGMGSLSDSTVSNPIYTPADFSGPQVVTLTVEVSDSEETIVATVDVNVTDAALLIENFNDGDYAGWTVVDQGTVSAPSSWSAAAKTLLQSRNIYEPPNDTLSIAKLGTYIWYNDGLAWSNYQVDFTMRSSDDDTVGVMFRYQDSNNYYRFSWDRERAYRRLVKNSGGVFSTLAEQYASPYNSNQTYQVRIIASGTTLQVWIDGFQVFSVTDGDLAAGSIAMYTWANAGTRFDDIVVQTID